jgi:predicted PolB exonuclease-like 3'-5' exonuclease
MMGLDSPILVFDIETVPDAEHHQGDEFPKALFHRVVAISYIIAEYEDGPDGPQLIASDPQSVGNVDTPEHELVAEFLDLIEQIRPRLVTFNGRCFDIPVLKYRALKYGLSAPWLCQGQSKWENYGQRFSVVWHCDLMDALSEFGASKAAKLSEVCALLGSPGKQGMDGSQVAAAIEAGQIDKVRAYCNADVNSTYQVFLRYAHLRGELTLSDGEASARS